MKSTVPEPSPDTRLRLILASIPAFAEKSFEGASIREIARQAKANSALIQYHFGGKEGLYLEAVKFVFHRWDELMQGLPPAPDPSSPRAREEAIQALRAHVRAMVSLACIASPRLDELYGSEVQKASFTLWNQALQTLRPSVAEFVREVTSRRGQHLRSCITVLRPGLSDEECFRMEMSIVGQLVHLHNRRELVRLLRGLPYDEGDLDSLAEHYFRFCLQGLGIQDARDFF